mgnify:CR=1 FL=1
MIASADGPAPVQRRHPCRGPPFSCWRPWINTSSKGSRASGPGQDRVRKITDPMKHRNGCHRPEAIRETRVAYHGVIASRSEAALRVGLPNARAVHPQPDRARFKSFFLFTRVFRVLPAMMKPARRFAGKQLRRIIGSKVFRGLTRAALSGTDWLTKGRRAVTSAPTWTFSLRVIDARRVRPSSPARRRRAGSVRTARQERDR